jgi:hypothetical protein
MECFLGENGMDRERAASRKVRIVASNVRTLRIVPINHGGITLLISAAQ